MLQPWLRHFFMSDCVVVEIKEPESAFPAGKPMDNSGLSVFFFYQTLRYISDEGFRFTHISYGDVPETLPMNDPLTAVNNTTQASDRLHQVFTMQSLHRKQQSDFCARTSFLYITRVGCFYCILKD